MKCSSSSAMQGPASMSSVWVLAIGSSTVMASRVSPIAAATWSAAIPSACSRSSSCRPVCPATNPALAHRNGERAQYPGGIDALAARYGDRAADAVHAVKGIMRHGGYHAVSIAILHVSYKKAPRNRGDPVSWSLYQQIEIS